MKSTVEHIDESNVRITISVPANEVDEYIADTYKELSKKYRFSGFRPGKVPRPVLDNAFGKINIYADARADMFEHTVPYAINDAEIHPLDQIGVDQDDPLIAGHDYEFEITIPVLPVFELTNYEPVEIELPPSEALPNEIQAQIEELREYYYSFEDVERPVEDKDFVVMSLSTSIEGEIIEGLQSDNRLYQLGSQLLPDAVDKELLGMKIGESKTIDYTVSGVDFGIIAKYAGKQATSEVKINKIRVKVLPEVTEEWAIDTCGFHSMDDMYGRIKDKIEFEKQSVLPTLKEQQCTYELAKRLEGEAPAKYVDEIQNDLFANFYRDVQSGAIDLQEYLKDRGITVEEIKDDLRKDAVDVAKQGMALDSLAKYLKIEVTTEDLDNEFIKSGVEKPVENRKIWEDEGRISLIIEGIKRERAVEWLKENAVVHIVDTDVKMEDLPQAEAKKEEKPAKEAKPKAKKAEKAQDADAPQKCEWITASGNQCKNNAKPGSKYCATHEKKAAEAEAK